MNKDEFVCNVCQKRESDSSTLLTCMYCFTSVHFKCKNIAPSAVRRMRNTDYFCSSQCSAIYQRIVMMQNNNNSMVSSLASEMRATISASVAKEMRTVTTEVKQIIYAIEKSQEFLSTKFDDIVIEFNRLKCENDRLVAEIEKLKKSQSDLREMVYTLECNADKADKVALDNNAILWGVPTATEENVPRLVEKLLVSVGLQGNSDHIKSAERLFSNGRSGTMVPIRIVFNNKKSKEMVFNKKKQYGKLYSTVIDDKLKVNGKATSVTLRNELSPLSLDLLKKLRESQEIMGVRYVWAGRGGTILVKRDNDSKPELVKNRVDLDRVMCHFVRSG